MTNHCKRFFLFFLLLCFLQNPAAAQDNYDEMDIDTLFEMARTEAFDGNYQQARELCSIILERSPDYHDVRILLGRTYAWEENYSKAREELNNVLETSPKYQDALDALCDVEYWSGNHEAALQTASRALNSYPTDESFIVKKTNILIQLERFQQASTEVNRLEDVNPSHPEIPSLRKRIGEKKISNTVTGSYSYETFSRAFDNTHFGFLEWNRRTLLGPIIGRLNFSRRFETFGAQPEIDWYPRITDGVYGYLNYGYSSSSVFPEHRAGAELYHRLPFSMEGSLGIRHLNFHSSDNITMYTGSLTKYYRNYYFNLRPYITPRSDGLSRSVTLTVRRYFGAPDDYIYASGGFGVSPQERIYQSVTDDIFFLESQHARIGLRKNIRYDLNLIASVDYTHQELLFSPGDFVNIYSFNVGVAVKF